jgi:methyl-accepting chemotaxis protein
MKLYQFFLLTHGATAVAIALVVIAAAQSGNATLMAVGSLLSLVTLLTAAWYATGRIRSGLANLEAVVVDQDSAETLTAGLIEFDQTADRIAVHATRWESVAANNRQQARDFQSMMFLLNRRGPDRTPSSDNLRGLLASLGNTLNTHLTGFEQHAREIESQTQSIAVGAESQGNIVVKTTAYLEQLSAKIDSVIKHIKQVESTTTHTSEVAGATRDIIDEISGGLQQAHKDSQACEKKLRGLSDPARQIAAIVASIGDIAARTDLLALNASIESIRAGEHGKQFAKVADEVRKLAEQSTDATREISSLLNSIQLVTQESIHRLVRSRENVADRVAEAAEAQQRLHEITNTINHGANHIQQIRETSESQSPLARQVLEATQKIGEIAKAARSEAENATWISRSFATRPADFASAISRLQQCSEVSRHTQDHPTDTIAAMPLLPALSNAAPEVWAE